MSLRVAFLYVIIGTNDRAMHLPDGFSYMLSLALTTTRYPTMLHHPMCLSSGQLPLYKWVHFFTLIVLEHC